LIGRGEKKQGDKGCVEELTVEKDLGNAFRRSGTNSMILQFRIEGNGPHWR